MDKSEFMEWAQAVVMHSEATKDANLAFLKEVETHDKQAAALARKTVNANAELADHLRKVIAKG